MRIMASILVATAALGAVQPAAAQGYRGGPPILGYHVVLKAGDGGETRGELIAVSPDSLWLLRNDALTVFPLASIPQVDIRQSSLGAGKVMLYSLLVGAISGGVLAAACSSVDGDCGIVFPVVIGSWAFFGGIAALSVGPSRYTELHMPAAEQLRPYARFPQGIPEGYR